MPDLQLAVKAKYFYDAKALIKLFEYRLYNEYWEKRLIGREYDRLIITLGYPKKGDMDRTLIFPYNGYEIQTITHPHFGDAPVKVFALILKDII